jgi:hypothetical protein
MILFNPKKDINKVFDKKHLPFLILIPICLSIVKGIGETLNSLGLSFSPYFMGKVLGGGLMQLVFILIICLSFSFAVWILSILLKGIANVGMIFSLVLFCLLPIIFGQVLLLLSAVTLYWGEFGKTFDITSLPLYKFRFIFHLWSSYIFIAGIKYINQFSWFKTILSSIWILILLGIIG